MGWGSIHLGFSNNTDPEQNVFTVNYLDFIGNHRIVFHQMGDLLTTGEYILYQMGDLLALHTILFRILNSNSISLNRIKDPIFIAH